MTVCEGKTLYVHQNEMHDNTIKLISEYSDIDDFPFMAFKSGYICAISLIDCDIYDVMLERFNDIGFSESFITMFDYGYWNDYDFFIILTDMET